jgi:ribosomal protein S18 acetylase RimI-like enzyme
MFLPRLCRALMRWQLHAMIEISRAQESELEAILSLIKLAFESEAEKTGNRHIAPLQETLEGIRAVWRSQPLLVAKLDGAIVGAGRVRLENGTALHGRLAVHPARRGQGIGRALIAAMEGTFPEARRYELFTSEYSTDNIRLYEGLGYRIYARRGTPEGVTLVVMEKQAGVVKPLAPGESSLQRARGLRTTEVSTWRSEISQ